MGQNCCNNCDCPSSDEAGEEEKEEECDCEDCNCDHEEKAKEKVESLKKAIANLGFQVEETEEGIKISNSPNF